MNVAAVLMEILRASGVRYLFGNPGTTELPFLDALPESGLEYIVALQEATAVAAADGYAQASGQVGVVNLHVLPGVANGISILHNASRARSPLVVTAGQQDTRLLFDEPILAGDMVRITEPFTKWSYELRRADEAPAAMRRALKLASTPPTGPVFLSLPMDLMTQLVEDSGSAAPDVRAGTTPDEAAVERAAGWLAGAQNPLVIAGDGVARARAVPALVALAERLGARVHGEPIYRRTVFPADHALWRGGLYPSVPAVRKALDNADAVLVVGASMFTWFLHAPGAAVPPELPLIQVGDDPWEVGKSHRISLGIVADVGATLRAIDARLAERMSETQRLAAGQRFIDMRKARATLVSQARTAAEADAGRTPISVPYLMHTLATLLPPDAVVVDESASSLGHVLRYLSLGGIDAFFSGKTGTLGWGMGAALGVQLASPGRKVVATIGDGSVMYAPQALWTAARYKLPVTYVVPNNSSYAILKAGMLGMGLPSAKKGIYPGMDLVEPTIDYLALARALGVRAERVEKPGELRDVLATCLAHPGPSLVDVAIDRGFKALA
jgi:benzoylformate decarboxylase